MDLDTRPQPPAGWHAAHARRRPSALRVGLAAALALALFAGACTTPERVGTSSPTGAATLAGARTAPTPLAAPASVTPIPPPALGGTASTATPAQVGATATATATAAAHAPVAFSVSPNPLVCRAGATVAADGFLPGEGAVLFLQSSVDNYAELARATADAAGHLAFQVHDFPIGTMCQSEVALVVSSIDASGESRRIPQPPLYVPVAGAAWSSSGTPWSAADYIDALAASGIQVGRSGRSPACEQVDGRPGIEYAGDAHFVLWVYPNEPATAGEWIVDDLFAARHRVLVCDRAPSRVYHQQNLVLLVPDAEPRTTELVDTFLTLGRPSSNPLPSDTTGFAIVPPPAGAPLGATPLLEQLAADGFHYTPYFQPACPYGTSRASEVQLVGPWPEEGPSLHYVTVWVYPTIADLESEWVLGQDGVVGAPDVHRSRSVDCTVGARIYRNENLLLVIGGPDDQPSLTTPIVDAFLGLRP